ncbi:hypothetical protein [Palleronia caenipelagi]|uniref:Uncharacterized protein n=1 Tax=Palleronia caenipelagi TaxID=2489174 RepID=A0A547Q7E5_9RHOB|nr:hypothetical protein [Palleronia caenipelagi]TRD22283.1 hypothetical protein FEV53_06065 [Palleronia caenipelagi]
MTALSKFERLEAPGIWHPEGDGTPRDVIVSLGDRSLSITGVDDIPVAHWFLPSIERLNPGKIPAMFGPGFETDEQLEIEDDLMIEAIGTIRKSVRRTQPKRGRVRLILSGTLFALLLVAAGLWAPVALIRYAASVTPDETRQEIDRQLIEELPEQPSGLSCRGDAASRNALSLLLVSLGWSDLNKVKVLPNWPGGATILPGGTLLLDASKIENSTDFRPIAKQILAARHAARVGDPLRSYLDGRSAYHLIMSKKMSETDISDQAERLLSRPPPTVSSAINAEVDRASEILTERQWAALQRICQV